MKRFVMATLVAAFVMSTSAFASVEGCIQDIKNACSASSSFYNLIRAKAEYCTDLTSSGGGAKYAVFRGSQGGLLTVGTKGQQKCKAQTYDLNGTYGSTVAVSFIEDSGNKLWLLTKQGNVLFMRMAAGSTLPEIYGLKNASRPPKFYSSATKIRSVDRDTVSIEFSSREPLRVDASDVQDWINKGRASKVETTQGDASNFVNLLFNFN
jgi:hypothetical protein